MADWADEDTAAKPKIKVAYGSSKGKVAPLGSTNGQTAKSRGDVLSDRYGSSVLQPVNGSINYINTKSASAVDEEGDEVLGRKPVAANGLARAGVIRQTGASVASTHSIAGDESKHRLLPSQSLPTEVTHSVCSKAIKPSRARSERPGKGAELVDAASLDSVLTTPRRDARSEGPPHSGRLLGATATSALLFDAGDLTPSAVRSRSDLGSGPSSTAGSGSGSSGIFGMFGASFVNAPLLLSSLQWLTGPAPPCPVGGDPVQGKRKRGVTKAGMARAVAKRPEAVELAGKGGKGAAVEQEQALSSAHTAASPDSPVSNSSSPTKGKAKSVSFLPLHEDKEDDEEEEGATVAPLPRHSMGTASLLQGARRDAVGRGFAMGAAYKRMSMMPSRSSMACADGMGGGRLSLFPGARPSLMPMPRMGAAAALRGSNGSADVHMCAAAGGRRRGGVWLPGLAEGGSAPFLASPSSPAASPLPSPAPSPLAPVEQPAQPAPSHVEPGLAVALGTIMDMLPSADLLVGAGLVCSSWRVAASQSHCWRVVSGLPALMQAREAASRKGRGKGRGQGKSRAALPVPTEPVVLTSLPALLTAFPWGRFLSSGAYKDVFAVWNGPAGRLEAVSVMDAQSLARSGNLPVVAAEVQCAVLLSGLVRQGVCPHFVETAAVWLHACTPADDFPAEHWGGDGAPPNPPNNPFSPELPSVKAARAALVSSGPTPRSAQGGKAQASSPALASVRTVVDRLEALVWHAGPSSPASALSAPVHVYIRMELCAGGDAEGVLRKVEPGVAAVEEAARAEREGEGGAEGLVQAIAGLKVSKAGGNLLDRRAKGRAATQGEGGNAGPVVHVRARERLAAVDAAAAASARCLLWQMLFSLYAARERVALRHGDVKLLNFFMSSAGQVAEATLPKVRADARTTINSMRLRYAFGGEVYSLQLGTGQGKDKGTALDPTVSAVSAGWLVKLADYGTAVTDAGTLLEPMSPHHFTTLENSPPEFLLSPDTTVQGYGTDAWALGLCGLHLLTGACPYEEWMEGARCPVALARELLHVWTRGEGAGHPHTYTCIRSLLEADEEGEPSTATTLADTLWRFAVLTGLGQRDGPLGGEWWAEPTDSYPLANPVWALLQAVTRQQQDEPKRKGKGKIGGMSAADLLAARSAFRADVSRYSMACGDHPLPVRARRRAAHMPGLLQLIRSLLVWQPEQRPRMRACLAHPAFAPLRQNVLDTDEEEDDVTRRAAARPMGQGASAWLRAPHGEQEQELVLSYAFYDRRDQDSDAEGALPDV